jgi:GntR family transcriptional regulator
MKWTTETVPGHGCIHSFSGKWWMCVGDQTGYQKTLNRIVLYIIEQICYNKSRTEWRGKMIIHIEPHADTPIYTQLTNQIIEGIARGNMRPGDSLPSVRALAGDLGVNMHTVNKSYHELEKRGIIRIIPKSGAVIQPVLVTPESPHYEHLTHELKTAIAEALVLGIQAEQVEELVTTIIQDLQQKTERE